MYQYKAKITKVVDGDTIDAEIDLGFYMKANIRFRLNRINTPEVRGSEKSEGVKSTEWLREKLNVVDNNAVIHTAKTGKYGRWLAELFINGININDELVKSGHAEYKDY